jgi:Putative esterase
VALRQVEGIAGPPWTISLSGELDELVVESDVLSENPLGDPARRPLYVYRSPAVAGGDAAHVPAVYVLQGYSHQLDTWLARKPFEPTFIERLDRLFTSGSCPAAIIVMVDAWTSLGGSQFINSAGTGRYMDYLCDEIVPFVDRRYPTLPDRDHRGISGHSSGGYGASVTAMLRPDVFGAFASHAGDALFEACYLRDFPVVARALRERFEGSYDVLLRRLREGASFDWTALSIYAMAAAYSPDPERPGEVLLPFEIDNGKLIEDVWARWLEHDPVRMASRCADALHAMRRIHLDAGRSDEYFLDLGAQAFSAQLSGLRVEHTLELFEGRHGGIAHRYAPAIRELLVALAA